MRIGGGSTVFYAEKLGTKSENLDIIVYNGMYSPLFGANFGPGKFKAVQ